MTLLDTLKGNLFVEMAAEFAQALATISDTPEEDGHHTKAAVYADEWLSFAGLPDTMGTMSEFKQVDAGQISQVLTRAALDFDIHNGSSDHPEHTSGHLFDALSAGIRLFVFCETVDGGMPDSAKAMAAVDKAQALCDVAVPNSGEHGAVLCRQLAETFAELAAILETSK